MRNILVLSLFIQSFVLYAQSENRILKVNYVNSPVSSHRMTDYDMKSTPTMASDYDFRRGIVDHYSLYINLEDRSSVYVLDSTTQVKPIGYENIRAALLDTIIWTVKTPEKITMKHEWIMEQTFFSEGKVGDVKWKLENETKVINGLNCHKAVATNFPMLTVWYTKDLPVSNGPSIYQGLPGLVIWAETYSSTTEANKIEYSDDVAAYTTLYEKMYNQFMIEKKKETNYDKEPLLMVKKGDLFRNQYKFFHKKPYQE